MYVLILAVGSGLDGGVHSGRRGSMMGGDVPLHAVAQAADHHRAAPL
jgi:hypothetical protein